MNVPNRPFKIMALLVCGFRYNAFIKLYENNADSDLNAVLGHLNPSINFGTPG